MLRTTYNNIYTKSSHNVEDYLSNIYTKSTIGLPK